jgi:hypothetical protein
MGQRIITKITIIIIIIIIIIIMYYWPSIYCGLLHILVAYVPKDTAQQSYHFLSKRNEIDHERKAI